MKKISKSPFFYKRIFPFIFAIPFLLFAIIPFQDGQHPPPPFFFLIPGIVWVVFLALWWQLYRGLADEVLDAGDSLLITLQGKQHQVPFNNIINVSATMMMNPPMVTLRLRIAGPFGRDISFLPNQKRQIRLWKGNDFVNELVDRIDAQRQMQGRKRL